ncbi:MAG: hypothetical protein J6C46_05015 [Clostridia bacterium]|nr:hypothetical protein [Clostridia bacterium]MBO5146729.1 hypothetical protein [Lachnospiraceae bacterium]
MKNGTNILQKVIGTLAGITLSIVVLAVKPMPDVNCLFFFGEPEYPSED